jgi:flagellar biogenesis protein FliO
MPPVAWLVAGFTLLALALLLACLWALRRQGGPREPSAAARQVIEQVDRDEDG